MLLHAFHPYIVAFNIAEHSQGKLVPVWSFSTSLSFVLFFFNKRGSFCHFTEKQERANSSPETPLVKNSLIQRSLLSYTRDSFDKCSMSPYRKLHHINYSFASIPASQSSHYYCQTCGDKQIKHLFTPANEEVHSSVVFSYEVLICKY